MTEKEIKDLIRKEAVRTRWAMIYQNRNMEDLCYCMLNLIKQLMKTCSDEYEHNLIQVQELERRMKENEAYTIKPFIDDTYYD